MRQRVAWSGVATGIVCLVLAAAPLAAQPTAVPPGGEGRISLDLKGLDILDVLKLLSQQSGLSFVAGRNVAGRVTLFVKDVPLWDAFELIVAANDLAYEQRGTIITVMSGRDYELIYGDRFQDPKAVEAVPLQFAKVAAVATVLNQVKTNVGRVIVDEPSNTVILMDLPAKVAQMRELLTQLDTPTKTFVWELQYAKVADLQEKLQAMLTPNVGTLKIDERTSKVIVTDLPAVIEKVDGMMRAFDSKTRQVLIDVKIIQVSLDRTHTLGIDWQGVMNAIDSQSRGSFDELGDVLGGAAKGVAFKYTAGAFGLTALIEALNTVGETNIVSSPSITATDNQEAKILVGTKEAFVTSTVVTPGGGSPTTTAEQVTFVDVGVNLAVTPTIKPDGFVNLKIRPEISSVDRELETASGNTIPIVKTSEAETNVLLKSGTTIILGGLIEDRTETNQNKIPFLGNLPLVGHAFGSTDDSVSKTETVIFMTPHIISGDENVLDMEDARAHAPAAETQLTTTPLHFELSAQQPVPAAYRDAIRQRLAGMLQGIGRMFGVVHGAATVTFRVHRNGTLLGDPVVEGVADQAMRANVADGVRLAAPFPAFPDTTALAEAQFRIAIEYGDE